MCPHRVTKQREFFSSPPASLDFFSVFSICELASCTHEYLGEDVLEFYPLVEWIVKSLLLSSSAGKNHHILYLRLFAHNDSSLNLYHKQIVESKDSCLLPSSVL